jgi:hypothetical protein
MSLNMRTYREIHTGRIILQSTGSNKSAANTAQLIAGGTAAAPVISETADTNFIEFRLKNTATSGDNRGIYNRLYLSGAGGGGESLRSFTSIKDVAAGTAHGAHISLNFEATGSVTGLGVGMRGTLHVPDNATFGGTVAAVQAEIFHDGAASTVAGCRHSNIRLVNGGNSSGVATHTTWMEIVGSNAVNFKTGSIGGTTKGIRIIVDGTVYYIACGTTCA